MDGSLAYTEGIMFQASQFADVSGDWAISFTLWSGANNTTAVDVVSNNTGSIEVLEHNKIIRMLNKDEKAVNWIKLAGKGQTEKLPRFTSAINSVPGTEYDRRVEAFGTVIMDMGIVESNAARCAMLPSRSNANWSIVDITKENIDKVISLFAARKVIESSWINSKDEYRVPNISDSRYEEWLNDSYILSIFNTAFNAVSLRDIECYDSSVNIQNEFFWMSSDIIEKLADGSLIKRLNDNRYQNSEILDDLEKFGDHERYVYLRLKELKDNNKLSAEALAVLNKAEDLVLSSFKYRKDFNERHPEYQINTWDAGWYQVKGMLKDYDKEGLKEFNSLYDTLANKMRPLVYELGFLYK